MGHRDTGRNHICQIEWHDARRPRGTFKVTFVVWNLPASHIFGNIARINLHVNPEVQTSVLSKVKDLSRKSQAVTYTVKVVISWKRCKIQTLLLQTTTMIYGLLNSSNSIPMTLAFSNRIFFIRLCSSWQDFNWCCTTLHSPELCLF